MKRLGVETLALAAFFALVVSSGMALGESEISGVTIDHGFDAGVQEKDTSGSREKFSEYRDVESGFLLNDFRLKVRKKDSPYFFDLKIKDPLQDDEYYDLNVGRHGQYRLNVEFDAIPHNFSSGKFLWGGFGSNRLQIADVVQQSLEDQEVLASERSKSNGKAVPTGPAADAQDQPTRAIVTNLFTAADDISFGLKREKISASFEYNLTKDVKSWIRASKESRDGARRIGAGVYERFDQVSGGVHSADLFSTSGAELAEPLEYRTVTVSAGAGIYRKSWLADVEYTSTTFRNEDDLLLWDNPFEATAGRPSTPGKERGRFDIGQLVLPPDSQSHDVTLSGSLSLPMHSRLIGNVGYGIITQNEDFEPYTRNAGVNDSPASDETADPQSVGVADVTNVASLPRSDLDGEVTNISASVVLTTRPVEPVSVTTKYRFYDYDNDSKSILFPGYAGFGESAFRVVKNDKEAPVINEPLGYTRQNADLSVDYRIAPPLTLSAEGGWEGWSFDNLRLDSMDDLSGGAGFNYKPWRTASFKAAYKYSDRSIDGYLQGRTEANPEATGLLNFNWAERQRHQADARLQMAPMDKITVGLSGRWFDDDYGGKTKGGRSVDKFRFGRTDLESVIGALDASFTPTDVLSFYANYSREFRQEKLANAAKDDAGKAKPFFGFNDNYAPVNFWNSDIDETTDTVGVGATAQLIPAKLTVDAGYNFSFGDMDIDNFNPNPVTQPQTLENAIAQNWPRIQSRLHEARIDLGYQFSGNFKAGVRYLFEWFDLDDFVWNDMQPFMAARSVENTTEFVFTNATYKDYTAHVGGVYLAYTWG